MDVTHGFAVWVEVYDGKLRDGYVDRTLEGLTLDPEQVQVFPDRDAACEFEVYSTEGPVLRGEKAIVEVHTWPDPDFPGDLKDGA